MLVPGFTGTWCKWTSQLPFCGLCAERWGSVWTW